MRSCVVLVVFALGCGARTDVDRGEPLARPSDAGLDARRDARDARVEMPFDATSPTDVGRDAPPDARDAFAPDAGDPCDVDPGPLTGALCRRPLFAEEAVLSCPGGFADVVAAGDGTLVAECDGPRVEARFGDRTYRGTHTGDRVTLCIQTEFDYVDGCRWQSSQRLEGDLASGELALSYREMSILGTMCFPPCSADARVLVR
jgi:hypothetical protein